MLLAPRNWLGLICKPSIDKKSPKPVRYWGGKPKD